jgi:hypothetical protein
VGVGVGVGFGAGKQAGSVGVGKMILADTGAVIKRSGNDRNQKHFFINSPPGVFSNSDAICTAPERREGLNFVKKRKEDKSFVKKIGSSSGLLRYLKRIGSLTLQEGHREGPGAGFGNPESARKVAISFARNFIAGQQGPMSRGNAMFSRVLPQAFGAVFLRRD